MQEVALKSLVKPFNQFCFFTAQQIKAASNGWLPKNFSEMFSDEGLVTIGMHLDIPKNAPVFPSSSWRDYINETAKYLQDGIDSVLKCYAYYLPEDIVTALYSIQQSRILSFYRLLHKLRQSDLEEGIQRPPVLGLGKDFGQYWADIGKLIDVINKEISCHPNLRTIKFPQEILHSENIAPHQGEDRINIT